MSIAGPRVGQLRGRLRATLRDLSEITGLNESSLKSYEYKGAEPSVEVVHTLIMTTGVDGNQLLGIPGAPLWGPPWQTRRRQVLEQLLSDPDRAAGTFEDRAASVVGLLGAGGPPGSVLLLSRYLGVNESELGQRDLVRRREDPAPIMERIVELSGIPAEWYATGDQRYLQGRPQADVGHWLGLITLCETAGVTPEMVRRRIWDLLHQGPGNEANGSQPT